MTVYIDELFMGLILNCMSIYKQDRECVKMLYTYIHSPYSCASKQGR